MKMKICIVMVDNRPVDGRLMTAEYNSVVACINANYAEKNGYDFCYYILTAGAGGGVNCVVDPWKRGGVASCCVGEDFGNATPYSRKSKRLQLLI